MHTIPESVIERVRKLLARAKSDNVHEAASAATIAHQMMLKHKLSQADVEGNASTIIGEWDVPGEFTPLWRFALLTAIAKSYYATTIRVSTVIATQVSGTRHSVRKETWQGKIISKKEDGEAIVYLFTYFENEIVDLCAKKMFDVLSEDDEDSFQRGAVYALQRRLLEQKNKFDQSSEKALVLAKRSDKDVKDYLNKKHRERESCDPGATKEMSSFYAGYSAGMSIALPGKERRLPNDDLGKKGGQ